MLINITFNGLLGHSEHLSQKSLYISIKNQGIVLCAYGLTISQKCNLIYWMYCWRHKEGAIYFEWFLRNFWKCFINNIASVSSAGGVNKDKMHKAQHYYHAISRQTQVLFSHLHQLCLNSKFTWTYLNSYGCVGLKKKKGGVVWHIVGALLF